MLLLALRSSGEHQVSVNLMNISCSLLFLMLEVQRGKKAIFKKTSSVLNEVTAALSRGWGAGCLSPGCLLVTCCEVGSEVTDQSQQPPGAKTGFLPRLGNLSYQSPRH